MKRKLALVLLVVVVGVLAAACGSSSSSSSDDADPSGSTGAPVAGEAFPVTIAHRFGETTVSEAPERVVTVGLTDQDAVLAVGVVPVGTTDWFGSHPGAIWPWATDELGDAPLPEVTGDAAAIGFEKIAALQPDLILAVYAGLGEPDYEKLEQIAPTVAQPDGYVDWGVPWSEQTRIIGRALGRSDEAETLVSGIESKFAAARAAHPNLAGAVGVTAVANPVDGTVSVYAPEDARGRFLADLGVTQPPEIAQLAGSEFSASLSREQIGLLDDDVVVWIVNSIETDRPKFAADPIYSALAVHRDGHEVFVENLGELGGALSFQSVLSLPILLDQLVPQVAAAVEGTAA